MCAINQRLNNPVRGPLNALIFNLLNGASHYYWGKRKEKLFANMQGTVVEIGSGTGANTRYLKAGTKLIAVEPNIHMHSSLRENARLYGLDVEIKNNMAENMDIKSDSIDVVFSTLTLCTIRQEHKALSEIKRILKPGGKFIFIEHVAAKNGTLLEMIQKLSFRPWFWLFEGCHNHKDIESSINGAGFSTVKLENFKMYSPFIPIIPQIAGYALK